MATDLPILLWDQAYNRNGDAKLPRAVINVIRTYVDNHNLSGWVSQETLAEATGMKVRGVRNQINANVEAGWLEVVKQGCAGRASVYRLAFPKPAPQYRVSEANTGTTVPVSTGNLNRHHSAGNTPETGTTVPVNPAPQCRPTSPRTSPQEKFSIETPTGSLAVAVETATGDNPFASAPTWLAHPRQHEESAGGYPEPAIAIGAPVGDPFS